MIYQIFRVVPLAFEFDSNCRAPESCQALGGLAVPIEFKRFLSGADLFSFSFLFRFRLVLVFFSFCFMFVSFRFRVVSFLFRICIFLFLFLFRFTS